MNESIRDQGRLFTDSIQPPAVRELIDRRIETSFELILRQISAHAGAIWIKPSDRDVLVIAYNAGSGGKSVENVVEQPLDSGLVSKAFHERKTICHQGAFTHAEKSDRIDRQLGQLTAHQIAVPFCLLDVHCGVMTAIQTYGEGVSRKTRWGFEDDAVALFESFVDVTSGLMEYNWLHTAVGL
jgi:hypothetical protein